MTSITKCGTYVALQTFTRNNSKTIQYFSVK